MVVESVANWAAKLAVSMGAMTAETLELKLVEMLGCNWVHGKAELLVEGLASLLVEN